jgi:hypothetical protein
MNARVTVRKGLEPLIGWVNFPKEMPQAKGHPTELRGDYERVDSLLRKLALPRDSPFSMEALRLVVNEAAAGNDDDYGDLGADLFEALCRDIGPRQQAWHRLRICRCGELFVALITRTQYCRACSNRERQRNFYKNHTTEERKRKKAAYRASKSKLDNAAKLMPPRTLRKQLAAKQ